MVVLSKTVHSEEACFSFGVVFVEKNLGGAVMQEDFLTEPFFLRDSSSVKVCRPRFQLVAPHFCNQGCNLESEGDSESPV